MATLGATLYVFPINSFPIDFSIVPNCAFTIIFYFDFDLLSLQPFLAAKVTTSALFIKFLNQEDLGFLGTALINCTPGSIVIGLIVLVLLNKGTIPYSAYGSGLVLLENGIIPYSAYGSNLFTLIYGNIGVNVYAAGKVCFKPLIPTLFPIPATPFKAFPTAPNPIAANPVFNNPEP